MLCDDLYVYESTGALILPAGPLFRCAVRLRSSVSHNKNNDATVVPVGGQCYDSYENNVMICRLDNGR